MYKSVYLKKGKEESLKRFHPWIFSGAIQAMDEGIEEGDIVRVFTRSGEFIAIGHYQIGSIAVRVLSLEILRLMRSTGVPDWIRHINETRFGYCR